MAKIYDTLLGEYIQNPGIRGLSLDKLSQKYFDYEMISYDKITNKGKISFKDIDLNLASQYSAEDVYITNKLFEKQEKTKIFYDEVLQNIEIPLIDVLKYMEISGVKIDKNKLEDLGKILSKQIASLKLNIFKLAGEEFNINSPKQVGEILFEKLSLPKGKKTKTGYSVGIEVLQNLSKEYQIAKQILEYRHYTKLLSTYIDGLIKILDENNFVYTSYNQTITATGRLSSTEPNLQNIPVGENISGEIRGAFISRFKNGKIASFDYSQVELRILAILSGDNHLIEAFKKEEDIHRKTAEFIFDKKDISILERKIAKSVNFGVIYGISAFGLSKMIDIGVKQAKEYIDKFFIKYPKVSLFFDDIIEDAKRKGYVESLFGRKRIIAGINDRNKIIQNTAIREAKNMVIQATAADIIKIAMIDIYNFLKEKKLKTKMIIQVHDELVFDVYPTEEKILQENISNIMQNVLYKNIDNFKFFLKKEDLIDLKVDFAIGENWMQAK